MLILLGPRRTDWFDYDLQTCTMRHIAYHQIDSSFDFDHGESDGEYSTLTHLLASKNSSLFYRGSSRSTLGGQDWLTIEFPDFRSNGESF